MVEQQEGFANKKINKFYEGRVTATCRFADKELEREYYNYEISKSLKYLRPVTLILGALFMLFIIPDFFFVKNTDSLFTIFLCRSVVIACAIIISFSAGRIQNKIVVSYFITLSELIAAGITLYILTFYPSPDFLILNFSIIVIVMSVFLLPNQWINNTFAAVFIGTGFFVASYYFFPAASTANYMAGIAHSAAVIVLAAVSSFRTNFLKRKQYIERKELLRLSITDALTGIYNRAKFNYELHEWMGCADRYNTLVSLIVFDFDDFKIINDRYGHLVGDSVMIETVKIVSENIRYIDIFARWGGEEFVILLPNTTKEQAVELSERLKNRIGAEKFENVGTVTCSFGVTELMKDDDAASFVKRADELLYDAKRAGKNTVRSYIERSE